MSSHLMHIMLYTISMSYFPLCLGVGLRSGLNVEEANALRRAADFSATAAATSAQLETEGLKLAENGVARPHSDHASDPSAAVDRPVSVSSPSASHDLRHTADEFIENAPGKQADGKWSGMVLGFVMIQDFRGQWDPLEIGAEGKDNQASLAETSSTGGTGHATWMQELFKVNRDKAKRHGYRLVVRRNTTLGNRGLVSSQWKGCQEHKQDDTYCRNFYMRQNHNWEKEGMLADYLNESANKYVLVMDGDAALVHHKHNTMQEMAKELSRTNRDVLMADEDWSNLGKGKLNGGLIFAKNTEFTRKFFSDIVQSHSLGDDYTGPGPKCKNNEQLCLAAAVKSYPGFSEKLLLVSGSRWNRHPCLWGRGCSNGGIPKDAKIFDPNLEVVHFMGGAKGGVHSTLHNLGLVK